VDANCIVMMKLSMGWAKNTAPAHRPANPRCCPGRWNCPGTKVFYKWNRVYEHRFWDWLQICHGFADRVPRSLCHVITNLSRLTGEAGRHLIKPSELYVGLILKLSRCTRTLSSSP